MEKDDARLRGILDVLSKYLAKDFSHTLPVSNKGDALDTLSAGLNALAGELRIYVAERQQYRESEEKFQKAFQASAAGITLTRVSDATYLDVNNTFTKMTGFSREELLGRSSADVGLIVNLPKRDEVLQLVRATGSAKDFEMTVRHRSGKLFTVLSSIETILLKGEKYAINIIYDITDRKIAEAQLQTANQELEAFSYSVSHDLRAPLRAVNGYAHMLQDKYGPVLDAEAQRLLGVIRSSASQMGFLIDDLLAFSRLGRHELRRQKVDMDALTASVILEVSQAAPHEARIHTHPLPVVNADPALLHQVLFNLISNAVKYSAKRPDPVVDISCDVQDPELIFKVKDNGAGFDMQYAGKLFGVFQRLHLATEFEGTGVGLAIVKRIIEKHGGRVWAEGKVDAGASFYFTLAMDGAE